MDINKYTFDVEPKDYRLRVGFAQKINPDIIPKPVYEGGVQEKTYKGGGEEEEPPRTYIPPTVLGKILVWAAKDTIFINFTAKGHKPINSIKVWKGEATSSHIGNVPSFFDPLWDDNPSIDEVYNDFLVNFYGDIGSNTETKSYFIKIEITDSEDESFQYVYPNVIPIGDYKKIKIIKHPDSIDSPLTTYKINGKGKFIDEEYEYAMGSKIELSAVPLIASGSINYTFNSWDKQINSDPSGLEIYEDPIYINLKQDTTFYLKYDESE